MLSDAQVERYSRQILHPRVGGLGQTSLLESAVVVALPASLAPVTARYLSGAGVGRIALLDDHGSDDSDAAWLVHDNPDVRVERVRTGSVTTAVDVVVAGADRVLEPLPPARAGHAHPALVLVAVHGRQVRVARVPAAAATACPACSAHAVQDFAEPRPAPPAPEAEIAAATIAAGECFDLLLEPEAPARLQHLDVEAAAIGDEPLPACHHTPAATAAACIPAAKQP